MKHWQDMNRIPTPSCCTTFYMYGLNKAVYSFILVGYSTCLFFDAECGFNLFKTIQCFGHRLLFFGHWDGMFFGSFLWKKFWSVLFDPVRFLGETGGKKQTQQERWWVQTVQFGETWVQNALLGLGTYCVVRFVVGKFRKQKKGTNGTPKKRDGVALCELFA